MKDKTGSKVLLLSVLYFPQYYKGV